MLFYFLEDERQVLDAKIRRFNRQIKGGLIGQD
jgi:hypothetical protein